METTFEWVIENLHVAPVEADMPQVIKVVDWRVNASDGEYTSTAYGSIGLPPAGSQNFTPYAELDKDTVVEWVKSAMDSEGEEDGLAPSAQIEANLAGEIAKKRNPPIVIEPLPWVN